MRPSRWQRPARSVLLALRKAAGGLASVLAALLLACFLLLHLVPGDPALRVAGLDATPEDVANVRHSLGLDRPLAEQFAGYVASLARLEFGKSFVTNEPVGRIIADRLPRTLELALAAMVLVMGISLPSACWPRRSRARTATADSNWPSPPSPAR
jgi:peptide/nickel transport system permease protein